MSSIYFEPDKINYHPKGKTTILKASKKAGIFHQNACGGRGKCSTCRVKILKGIENCHPRNSRERKIANALGFQEDIRLACQTVFSGDLTVKRLVLDEIDREITQSRAKSRRNHQIGEEVEATLVFMDLYNFTSFTEKHQAYDVVHLLNRYYYLAGKAIDKQDGTILDYYGDGILAIFGHKKNKNNHADKAIMACREIISQLDKLNNYINLITPFSFRLRIGVHTGWVIVGTMGMAGFEKLAVVGDDVNVASRIENANKKYNTTILISESTKQFLRENVEIINQHEVVVKGKRDKIKVYEINLNT